MEITFKKFKHHASQSRETTAYTAEIWADGKHIGYARNDGGGGETDIDFVSPSTIPDIEKAKEWASSLPPVKGSFGELEMHLDFYLDMLANVYITANNRTNKKNGFITYFAAKAHVAALDTTGIDAYPEFRLWRAYNGVGYKPTEAVV